MRSLFDSIWKVTLIACIHLLVLAVPQGGGQLDIEAQALTRGSVVTVAEALLGRSDVSSLQAGRVQLSAGQLATVVGVDDNGNVQLRIRGFAAPVWVLHEEAGRLLKAPGRVMRRQAPSGGGGAFSEGAVVGVTEAFLSEHTDFGAKVGQEAMIVATDDEGNALLSFSCLQKEKWVGSADLRKVLLVAEGMQEGSIVEVTAAFLSDGVEGREVLLSLGLRGAIVVLEHGAAALIKFEGLEDQQWVLARNFRKLKLISEPACLNTRDAEECASLALQGECESKETQEALAKECAAACGHCSAFRRHVVSDAPAVGSQAQAGVLRDSLLAFLTRQDEIGQAVSEEQLLTWYLDRKQVLNGDVAVDDLVDAANTLHELLEVLLHDEESLEVREAADGTGRRPAERLLGVRHASASRSSSRHAPAPRSSKSDCHGVPKTTLQRRAEIEMTQHAQGMLLNDALGELAKLQEMAASGEKAKLDDGGLGGATSSAAACLEDGSLESLCGTHGADYRWCRTSGGYWPFNWDYCTNDREQPQAKANDDGLQKEIASLQQTVAGLSTSILQTEANRLYMHEDARCWRPLVQTQASTARAAAATDLGFGETLRGHLALQRILGMEERHVKSTSSMESQTATHPWNVREGQEVVVPFLIEEAEGGGVVDEARKEAVKQAMSDIQQAVPCVTFRRIAWAARAQDAEYMAGRYLHVRVPTADTFWCLAQAGARHNSAATPSGARGQTGPHADSASAVATLWLGYCQGLHWLPRIHQELGRALGLQKTIDRRAAAVVGRGFGLSHGDVAVLKELYGCRASTSTVSRLNASLAAAEQDDRRQVAALVEPGQDLVGDMEGGDSMGGASDGNGDFGGEGGAGMVWEPGGQSTEPAETCPGDILVASGAGDEAVNGEYAVAGTSDGTSRDEGTRFWYKVGEDGSPDQSLGIFRKEGSWTLGDAAEGSVKYNSHTTEVSEPPLEKWQVGTGEVPAPKLHCRVTTQTSTTATTATSSTQTLTTSTATTTGSFRKLVKVTAILSNVDWQQFLRNGALVGAVRDSIAAELSKAALVNIGAVQTVFHPDRPEIGIQVYPPSGLTVSSIMPRLVDDATMTEPGARRPLYLLQAAIGGTAGFEAVCQGPFEIWKYSVAEIFDTVCMDSGLIPCSSAANRRRRKSLCSKAATARRRKYAGEIADNCRMTCGLCEKAVLELSEVITLSGEGVGNCVKEAEGMTANLPMGDDIDLDGYTIEALVKLDSDKTEGTIVSWGDRSMPGHMQGLRFRGNARQLRNFWGSNDLDGDAESSLADGQFHHVAATWDGMVRRLWVDFKLIAEAPATGYAVQDKITFCVGAIASDLTSNFKGEIKELKIWREARDNITMAADLPMLNVTTSTTTALHNLGIFASTGKLSGNWMDRAGGVVELAGEAESPCLGGGVGEGSCAGEIVYEFSCEADAEVSFQVEALAPDNQSDSLFEKVDKRRASPWSVGVLKFWNWSLVSPIEAVSRGSHSLTLGGREDNLRLRRLRFAKGKETCQFSTTTTTTTTEFGEVLPAFCNSTGNCCQNMLDGNPDTDCRSVAANACGTQQLVLRTESPVVMAGIKIWTSSRMGSSGTGNCLRVGFTVDGQRVAKVKVMNSPGATHEEGDVFDIGNFRPAAAIPTIRWMSIAASELRLHFIHCDNFCPISWPISELRLLTEPADTGRYARAESLNKDTDFNPLAADCFLYSAARAFNGEESIGFEHQENLGLLNTKSLDGFELNITVTPAAGEDAKLSIVPLYFGIIPVGKTDIGLSVGHGPSRSSLEVRMANGAALCTQTFEGWPEVALGSTASVSLRCEPTAMGRDCLVVVNDWVSKRKSFPCDGVIYNSDGGRFGRLQGWRFVGTLQRVSLCPFVGKYLPVQFVEAATTDDATYAYMRSLCLARGAGWDLVSLRDKEHVYWLLKEAKRQNKSVDAALGTPLAIDRSNVGGRYADLRTLRRDVTAIFEELANDGGWSNDWSVDHSAACDRTGEVFAGFGWASLPRPGLYDWGICYRGPSDRAMGYAPCEYEACSDEAGWTNGKGRDCDWYSQFVCSAGGARSPAWQKIMGKDFNFPEHGCCECGKGSMSYFPYINNDSRADYGGVEIDTPATAPVGFSLLQCKERCSADLFCDCFSLRRSNGQCMKRRQCNPKKFASGDNDVDTYVKSTLVPYQDLVCDENAGTPVGEASPQTGLSAAECQRLCDMDPECHCVAHKRTVGECAMFKDCQTQKFQKSLLHDSFIKHATCNGTTGVFNCPAGYTMKSNPEKVFCQWEQCYLSVDRETCCELEGLCNAYECPSGWLWKRNTTNLHCVDATCSAAENTNICCEPLCNIYACPVTHVLKLDASRITGNDTETCCDKRAMCTTLGCPRFYVSKLNASEIQCLGKVCKTFDRDTCCDVTATCSTMQCPQQYYTKTNASNRSQMHCAGKVCKAFDRDTCCDPAASCSTLSCPQPYARRNDFKSVNCTSSVCSPSVDLPVCCRHQVGTSITFNSNASTKFVALASLSAMNAIVCYKDGEPDMQGEGFGTCNGMLMFAGGNNLTVGEDLVINEAETTDIAMAGMNASAALVCYSDVSQGRIGVCGVLKLTGLALDKTTNIVVNPDGMSPGLTVAALTEELAIVCFQDSNNGDFGMCVAVETAGSKGAKLIVNAGHTLDMKVIRFSNMLALVCYADVDNRGLPTCNLLEARGTTLSKGPDVILSSAGTISHFTMTSLSENVAVICYADRSNERAPTCNVLTVQGGLRANIGNDLVIASGEAFYLSLTRTSESTATLCYWLAGEDHLYYCNVLAASAEIRSLVKGPQMVNEDEAAAYDINAVTMVNTTMLLCYRRLTRMGGTSGMCNVWSTATRNIPLFLESGCATDHGWNFSSRVVTRYRTMALSTFTCDADAGDLIVDPAECTQAAAKSGMTVDTVSTDEDKPVGCQYEIGNELRIVFNNVSVGRRNSLRAPICKKEMWSVNEPQRTCSAQRPICSGFSGSPSSKGVCQAAPPAGLVQSDWKQIASKEEQSTIMGSIRLAKFSDNKVICELLLAYGSSLTKGNEVVLNGGKSVDFVTLADVRRDAVLACYRDPTTLAEEKHAICQMIVSTSAGLKMGPQLKDGNVNPVALSVATIAEDRAMYCHIYTKNKDENKEVCELLVVSGDRLTKSAMVSLGSHVPNSIVNLVTAQASNNKAVACFQKRCNSVAIVTEKGEYTLSKGPDFDTKDIGSGRISSMGLIDTNLLLACSDGHCQRLALPHGTDISTVGEPSDFYAYKVAVAQLSPTKILACYVLKTGSPIQGMCDGMTASDADLLKTSDAAFRAGTKDLSPRGPMVVAVLESTKAVVCYEVPMDAGTVTTSCTLLMESGWKLCARIKNAKGTSVDVNGTDGNTFLSKPWGATNFVEGDAFGNRCPQIKSPAAVKFKVWNGPKLKFETSAFTVQYNIFTATSGMFEVKNDREEVVRFEQVEGQVGHTISGSRCQHKSSLGQRTTFCVSNGVHFQSILGGINGDALGMGNGVCMCNLDMICGACHTSPMIVEIFMKTSALGAASFVDLGDAATPILPLGPHRISTADGGDSFAEVSDQDAYFEPQVPVEEGDEDNFMMTLVNMNSQAPGFLSKAQGDEGLTQEQSAAALGFRKTYFKPTVVLAPSALGAAVTTTWVNTALQGKRFSVICQTNGPQTITIFAMETATITAKVNDSADIVQTFQLGKDQITNFTSMLNYTILHITSTGNVLVTEIANGSSSYFAPVPPAAKSVYGAISASGRLAVHAAVKAEITEECSDGSTTVYTASVHSMAGLTKHYNGKSCRYSVSGDNTMAGLSFNDGDGEAQAAVSFLEKDLFQKVIPIPVTMSFVKIISDVPADCNLEGLVFKLAGSDAYKVYHHRLNFVPGSRVLKCQQPVMVIASDDQRRSEVNLIAASSAQNATSSGPLVPTVCNGCELGGQCITKEVNPEVTKETCEAEGGTFTVVTPPPTPQPTACDSPLVTTCSDQCFSPSCLAGSEAAGGAALKNREVCVDRCSAADEATGVRTCGIGEAYTAEGSIDCSGCEDPPNSTFTQMFDAAECCRNKQLQVGSMECAPTPQHCEARCYANSLCQVFSHSSEFKMCLFCKGCEVSIEGTSAMYTTWQRHTIKNRELTVATVVQQDDGHKMLSCCDSAAGASAFWRQWLLHPGSKDACRKSWYQANCLFKSEQAQKDEGTWNACRVCATCRKVGCSYWAEDQTQLQRCTGHFGQTTGEQACCSQSSTISSADDICPEEQPQCVGFSGVQYGRCRANTLPAEKVLRTGHYLAGNSPCADAAGDALVLTRTLVGPRTLSRCAEECAAVENCSGFDFVDTREFRGETTTVCEGPQLFEENRTCDSQLMKLADGVDEQTCQQKVFAMPGCQRDRFVYKPEDGECHCGMKLCKKTIDAASFRVFKVCEDIGKCRLMVDHSPAARAAPGPKIGNLVHHTACYLKMAKCSTYVCPRSYQWRHNASAINCIGSSCAAADRDTCCEKRATLAPTPAPTPAPTAVSYYVKEPCTDGSTAGGLRDCEVVGLWGDIEVTPWHGTGKTLADCTELCSKSFKCIGCVQAILNGRSLWTFPIHTKKLMPCTNLHYCVSFYKKVNM
eukprot:TRINITY_DN36245_c0_g1_i1.p1 TRINITY_DN36245_c0_g1~~TRINITY_DN36245_c0_g1_i1.p1  ORF type:complete len:4591 (+),score=1010.58 TRINITY_DN36245_c0_g1_i1:235-14007(+)